MGGNGRSDAVTTKEVQTMDDVKATENETISAKRRDFLKKAATVAVAAPAAAGLDNGGATSHLGIGSPVQSLSLAPCPELIMIAPLARILLTAATAALLAACAGGSYVPDGPPAFKAGYIDGCNQGYYDGGYHIGHTTDRDALANDPVFRAGYEQGHATCYELQLVAPRAIGTPGGTTN